MRKFLLYLVIYNYIFPIRLVAIPKFEWFILSLPLIYVYLNWHISSVHFRHIRYRTTLSFGIVMGSLGLLSSLLHYGDFMSPGIFMKFFLMLIIANSILIWSYHIYGDAYLDKIFTIMVVSGLIIAASNFVEFFIPSFRIFLLKLIAVTGNSSYDISFRTHGFASSGGASLSLGMVCLSLIAYLKFSVSVAARFRIFYFVSFLFIYVSNIVIGRTGLFLGAPIVFYLLLFGGLSIFNLGKRLLLIVSIVFLGVQIVSIIDTKLLDVLYMYGLEPVYKYVHFGSFESKTTTGVSKMYFMPQIEHLLTGAGFWRWPTNGYSLPDPGYMKILVSTGILGFIIFYVYQFIIYLEAFKFFKVRYNSKVLLMFLFFILFLAEFKEAVFVQNYAFKILMLLITYSWFNKRSESICVE